jgi:hypothetical protein
MVHGVENSLVDPPPCLSHNGSVAANSFPKLAALRQTICYYRLRNRCHRNERHLQPPFAKLDDAHRSSRTTTLALRQAIATRAPIFSQAALAAQKTGLRDPTKSPSRIRLRETGLTHRDAPQDVVTGVIDGFGMRFEYDF